MFRMSNVDSIYDTLLVEGILLESLKQPLDTRTHIELVAQLLNLIVAIRPTLLHPVDHLLLLAIWTNRVVVECSEPALSHESPHIPRHHQHIKQVGEAFSAHAVRSGCQSKESCLRPSLPQHPVSLCHSMVSLINNNQRRRKHKARRRALSVELIATDLSNHPCQRLHRSHHHRLPRLRPSAPRNHAIVNAMARQKLASLLNKFNAVSHNQHPALIIPGVCDTVKLSLHQLCEHDSLAGARWHLHHHAPLFLQRVLHLTAYLCLVVSQHFFLFIALPPPGSSISPPASSLSPSP